MNELDGTRWAASAFCDLDLLAQKPNQCVSRPRYVT